MNSWRYRSARPRRAGTPHAHGAAGCRAAPRCRGTGKVRREIVVARGIADLVDRQVVGPLPVTPDEVVRRTRARPAIHQRLVDEHVDLVLPSQVWQQLRAADSDARPGGRHRAEPRETCHRSILRHGDPLSPALRRVARNPGQPPPGRHGPSRWVDVSQTASIGPAWPSACDSMRSLKGRVSGATSGTLLAKCSEAEHRQRSA